MKLEFILMKLDFLQIFEKYSNIKFHENPSIWNLVVPSGRTDRRIDITKLIVALRNYAYAPKMARLGITSHITRVAVNYLACLPTYKCLLFI